MRRSPLSTFATQVCDTASLAAKSRLGKPLVPANLLQRMTQETVFGSVDRFFHCSHYRNMLECYQIGNTAMLKLPSDWRTCSGDKLADELLAQLADSSLQVDLSRQLAAAAVDLIQRNRTQTPRAPRPHGLENEQVVLEFLARYNKMIVDRTGDDRLLVEIPFTPEYRTVGFRVPTYDPEGAVEYDYNRCEQITLQEVDGIRAVMGDPRDPDSPNVIIERAVSSWRVFVHADDADPFCIIEIRHDRATIETDDGRLLLERPLS